MNKISKLTSVSAGVLLACAFAAHATPIQNFSNSGGSGSGAFNAEADFTVGNGTVTLVLKNLQQDPISAGQLISGLSFSISSLTGSAVLSSSSGNVANIAADGTYTAPGSATSPLPRWHVSGTSGTTVSMTALGGGQPSDLIIGADSKGGFNGAGVYDKQNASIGNFEPSILGSATFIFALTGVTVDSQITHVMFSYGTGPDTTSQGSKVPDSGLTVAMLGAGLIGLIGIRRKFAR